MSKRFFNTSNIVSIVFHILLLLILLNVRNANIIVPSRSNGMEVAVISPEDFQQEQQKPQNIIEKPEPIKVQEQPADINIKQNVAIKKQPITTISKPKKAKTPPPPPTAIAHKTPKSKPKVKPNQELDDILGQIDNAKNPGKSAGEATGGSDAGTSDTSNLINDYADQVIRLVRPFVTIPDGINPDAFAIVKVVLLPNMHVYKVSLIQSSGNSDYDDSVQQAITRAQIFPPLPDGAKWVDFRVLNLKFKPQ